MAVSRSIARTTIGWGLVTIPVSLSLTASAKDSTVRMHQYSPAGNRIQQKRVDSVTGEEVAYGDIRKCIEVGSEAVLRVPYLSASPPKAKCWATATD